MFFQGLYHFLLVFSVHGRETDGRVFGFFASEILHQDQFALGFEKEGLKFILHKMLFGDFDGMLSAGKHAYRVIAYYKHFPLITVGQEIWAFQVIDPVNKNVDG
jgi:hypothetical protein